SHGAGKGVVGDVRFLASRFAERLAPGGIAAQLADPDHAWRLGRHRDALRLARARAGHDTGGAEPGLPGGHDGRPDCGGYRGGHEPRDRSRVRVDRPTCARAMIWLSPVIYLTCRFVS